MSRVTFKSDTRYIAHESDVPGWVMVEIMFFDALSDNDATIVLQAISLTDDMRYSSITPYNCYASIRSLHNFIATMKTLKVNIRAIEAFGDFVNTLDL